MKSFFNPSFDYLPILESATSDNDERVWRELGEREDAEADRDADTETALRSHPLPGPAGRPPH